jgi:hypothetical protein
MHTIDLLRGQGIPAKTTLGSAAMLVVMVVVPILAAAWMVDRYLQNKTEIGIKQQKIAAEQGIVEKLSDAVEFQESLRKQRQAIYRKLSEVSSCVDNFIQWSPVLETLARYMPSEMVMNGIKAESIVEQQKVKSEKNPNRTVVVAVPRRRLVLDISGRELRDYGSEVENYSRLLKSSPVMRPKLENIEVSQKPVSTGELNTVSYTMNLMFKSGSM